MKTTFALFTISIAFTFLSCEKEPEINNLTPKEIALTAHAHQVIAGSNEFGIELFTKVADDDGQNLMLSPLSASEALTMVLNGASGDTYSQLISTLKYPEELSISDINEAYKSLVTQLLEADPKVKIAIANALFHRNDFIPKQVFLDIMSTDFGAHIEGLDFSSPTALETINGWAYDNTYGKIPKVLDEIPAAAVMYIMNALYFKGNWSYQFDKSLTSSKPFYLDNGSNVDASTMTGNIQAKSYYSNSFSTIELPYGRTNFAMDIVVPSGSLAEFFNSFTYDIWSEITTNLDNQPEGKETIVEMPKFNFSYEKVLNDQLQSMGMIDAFSPLANFSNITDHSIYISFVKQNTFVEVNEEGTEAAAVTTVEFVETSGPGPDVFFINKPFIFAIRERTTNTMLFIGKVENPNL